MVDSKELISEFPGLRYLCSLIVLGNLRNLDDLISPFSSKKLPDVDDFIPTGTKNDQY
jgi:hypothetical protein